MTKRHDVQRGSGNVFADLGLPNPQEALMKAELARRIDEVVRARRLTQTQAAGVMGIDQPKVSSIRRGKLSGFTVDRLLRYLNALDQDIEIKVYAKPRRSSRPARLIVSVG
mgnify:FL=1